MGTAWLPFQGARAGRSAGCRARRRAKPSDSGNNAALLRSARQRELRGDVRTRSARENLPFARRGNDIVLGGAVASLPAPTARGKRSLVDVESTVTVDDDEDDYFETESIGGQAELDVRGRIADIVKEVIDSADWQEEELGDVEEKDDY